MKMVTIENQINSIFELLKAKAPEGCKAVKERPGKWASSRGAVSLYKEADLQRQKSETGFKARPTEMYVFYPGIYDPERLGSVAIYGGDATTRCRLIKATRSLFGIPVRKAEVEWGLRPYVDVTFAA